jgi:hypothetical protein
MRIYRKPSVRKIRQRVTIVKPVKKVNYKEIKANRQRYYRTISWTRAYQRCNRHRQVYKEYLKKANTLRNAYLKTPAAKRTTAAEAEFRKLYAVAYGENYVNRLAKTV